MPSFNVHDSVVQAAVIESASRLAVATGATAEKTAAIARELLDLIVDKPSSEPYAPIPDKQ